MAVISLAPFWYRVTIVAPDRSSMTPKIWEELDNMAEEVKVNPFEQPEFWIPAHCRVPLMEVLHELSEIGLFHTVSFEQGGLS